jgi:hypothetical protein
VDALNLVLAIIGVVLGLVAIPAAWREWQKRRWHVLDVSAHVEPHWAPVLGEENSNVLVGGTMTVENRGVYPVTNVHVLGPEALSSHPSTYRPAIAPGQRIAIELTAEQMMALPVHPLVELQVIDHRRRGWSWTPEAQYVNVVTGKRVGLKPLAEPRPWWTRLPGGAGVYVRRAETRRERALEERKLGP